MKYYIGADLGTSALKLLLVNVEGEIIKTVSRDYAISYPNPGWSEQNPEDWWNAFLSCMEEIKKGIEATAEDEIQLGKEQEAATIKELYAYQEKVQRAYIECLGSVKQHLG